MLDKIKSILKKSALVLKKQYHKTFYGSCAVLLYHRVTDLKTDPQLLAVSPKNFDAQLDVLSNKYCLLTIDEFYKHLHNKKKFPKNSVLLTFDDGYADNYLEALPLLVKHKAQALFYVATGTLNTSNEYWWDAVERIVLLSPNIPANATFILNTVPYKLESLDLAKRLDLYEKFLVEFRKLPSFVRDGKINELAQLFGSTEVRVTHRAMTFDELKKMNASSSAVIGAHTHLHPSLAALNFKEQFDEISSSKKILEEIIGKKITHFSYPFGTQNDYNTDTIKIVKQLDFKMVAANFPYIVHKNSDRYRFPRFLVRNWKAEEFEKNLQTFFA